MTADELKAWRSRLGLTQAAAAAQLGVSERQYIRLEMGKGGITQTIALLTQFIEGHNARRKRRDRPVQGKAEAGDRDA